MAKVTDLNTVQEFARQCIEDNGTQLLEFLTMDAAVNCFTMIYMTNDPRFLVSCSLKFFGFVVHLRAHH